MNIFLHIINLFFISVLESKQSLVQSFDTACTKSKCTQSSRGLGCSYQKLYHIRGEQSHWLVATITDQCSGLPQSQKNTVLQKGIEMHLGSKKKQMLCTDIIQSLIPFEHVGMLIKTLNLLWHIQMSECLHCGPTRSGRLHAAVLKPHHSSGVSFFTLPRSMSHDWEPSQFRVSCLSSSVPKAPCSSNCVYKKQDKSCAVPAGSTVLKAQALETGEQGESCMGFWPAQKPKANPEKSHPAATKGGRDQPRTGRLSVLLQGTH